MKEQPADQILDRNVNGALQLMVMCAFCALSQAHKLLGPVDIIWHMMIMSLLPNHV